MKGIAHAKSADLRTSSRTRKNPQPMTEQNQKQLGKTLWNISDQLRGAMNAEDFRDTMLAFLFRRYLSGNIEAS